SAMQILLLFIYIFQVAQSLCPDGFELVQNECRGVIYDEEYIWLIHSKKKGKPLIIHNEEVTAITKSQYI
ncbi:hypothetical protein PENTCL1PPCAC_20892, partial [Pristionchus entomophagus]